MKNLLSYLLYIFLFPIIKIIWEPISKKRSHWLHWKNINMGLYLDDTVSVFPDLKAQPRQNAWSMFWQTNFFWKKVAIVKPTDDCHTLNKYRIGIMCEYNENVQICTIPISKDNSVALLVGDKPLIAFALDHDGNQIPLKLVKISDKYHLPKGVKLF
jgi:hypothetical protein